MDINFDWRASVTKKLQVKFEKFAADNLCIFFKYFPEEIKTIDLTVIRPSNGADAHNLIKNVPINDKFGLNPSGTPVIIHLEGTQGLVCLMSVDEKTTEEIINLVEEGPYQRKLKPLKQFATTAELLEEEDLLEDEETSPPNILPSIPVQSTIPEESSEKRTLEIVDSFSDNDLLHKVIELIRAKKEAQAELVDASGREFNLNEEVHALEILLEQKRDLLAKASVAVEAAKNKIIESQISDELREKARAAKARLDATLHDL